MSKPNAFYGEHGHFPQAAGFPSKFRSHWLSRIGFKALPSTKRREVKEQPLSRQERRVLERVAEGKTNREIAAEMALSLSTVKNYLSSVFQKLQVRRRSQAVAQMFRRVSK